MSMASLRGQPARPLLSAIISTMSGRPRAIARCLSVPCGIAAGVSVALIFSIRLWQETVYGKETTEQTVRAGFEIEDTLYCRADCLDWGDAALYRRCRYRHAALPALCHLGSRGTRAAKPLMSGPRISAGEVDSSPFGNFMVAIVSYGQMSLWVVLAEALVLTALSGFYAAGNLKIDTDTAGMISEDLPTGTVTTAICNRSPFARCYFVPYIRSPASPRPGRI